METLAIIPARGASKGLPGKNILPLAGIPLIAHTIKAAQESNSVNRIIVSTDDDDIAQVAQDAGAEVPFTRPAHLSDDNASGIDTCLHALQYVNEELNYHPERLLYLQPTSPLRTSADIDAAVQLLKDKKADSVVGLKSVTEYPQWMQTIDNEKRINPRFPNLETANTRQNLQETYILNGAIYLSTTKALKQYQSFYGGDTRGYLMPADRSIDIDNLQDFLTVEALINHAKSQL